MHFQPRIIKSFKRDKKFNNKQSNIDITKLISTIGVIAAIILGVNSYYHSEKVLKITKEQFINLNRPFIKISIKPIGELNIDKDKVINLKNLEFKIIIKNVGKTPAINVDARYYPYIENIPPKEKSPSSENIGIILPDEEIIQYYKFLKYGLSDWFKSDIKFYIYYICDYKGIDGSEYQYSAKYLIDQNPTETTLDKIIAINIIENRIEKSTLYYVIENMFEKTIP